METSADRRLTTLIDDQLDSLVRHRDAVLAQPASADRSRELARLAGAEAVLWEQLAAHCRVRAYWRAALAAREHALTIARTWRRHAEQQGIAAPVRQRTVFGTAA